MRKAKVIRGVYIRGTAYAEGSIVDLLPQEFDELRSANYVIAAPEPAPAKPQQVSSTVTIGGIAAKGKAGDVVR